MFLPIIGEIVKEVIPIGKDIIRGIVGSGNTQRAQTEVQRAETRVAEASKQIAAAPPQQTNSAEVKQLQANVNTLVSEIAELRNMIANKTGDASQSPAYNHNSTDFSHLPSFDKAFQTAHTMMGPGKVFWYKGKDYSTNCADGGTYKFF